MKSMTKDMHPQIIEMYKQGKSCHAIARELDICRVSLTGVLKRNGFAIRGCKRLDESQYDEICNAYLNGETIRETAERYNVSWNVIRRILRKRHIMMRSNESYKRIYQFDQKYFDAIDTPDKAYFLGFLWADGHNSKESKLFLFVNPQDVDILEKFKKALGSEHKLIKKTTRIGTKEYPNTGLQITSVYLSAALTKLGMHNQKKYRTIMPVIDPSLMSHFVRGYMDGDGSLTLNQKRGPQITFACQNDFLVSLRKYLEETFDIAIYTKQKTRYGVLYISGNKQVSRLLHGLYKESKPEIRLDRKYKRYVEIMNYCAERAHDKTRLELEIHQ